jgi:hypothetical protein
VKTLPKRQVYRPYAGVQGLILLGSACDWRMKERISLVSGLGREQKLGCGRKSGEIPITGPRNHPAFCNKACTFNAIEKINVEKGVSIFTLASYAREFFVDAQWSLNHSSFVTWSLPVGGHSLCCPVEGHLPLIRRQPIQFE